MNRVNCPKCSHPAKEQATIYRHARVHWYKCGACNLEFNLTEFERANQTVPTLEQLS